MSKKLIFPLGQVVITKAALDVLNTHQLDGSTLLLRHQSGDWGDVCQEDKDSNEEALVTQGRLLSSYHMPVADTVVTIWIITEWDRSVTTLLLPNDY